MRATCRNHFLPLTPSSEHYLGKNTTRGDSCYVCQGNVDLNIYTFVSLCSSQQQYSFILLRLIAVIYQKRLKKERKARRRLQDQLELEMKRRSQLEEALKASGASTDALRMLNGEYAFYFFFFVVLKF